MERAGDGEKKIDKELSVSRVGVDSLSFDDLQKGKQETDLNIDAAPINAPGVECDAMADKKETTSPDLVDDIQQHLGGYGRYQILIFLLLSLVYMRGGWHVWISIYQGWTPTFHCKRSPGLNLNDSVPYYEENGQLVFSQCDQYVNLTLNNKTEACTNGWEYLWESSYTSIVSEYNLVCADSYQNELTSTMYMVGSAVGVLTLTPLADRFGTKSVMLVSLWSQAVFGTVLIWSSNIIVFCLWKFLIGLTNMTIALNVFVLMTETFDANHRTIPIIALEFFWSFGIMSLALLGYLIPDWKDLELTIALPINILSVSFIFIIPEPLPFLLSKGKVKKAKKVIALFLKVNRLPNIPEVEQKLSAFQSKNNNLNAAADSDVTRDPSDKNVPPPKVYTVFSLFRTPKLRMISIIMFYLFLVNSLSYFGIMFNTPALNGDRFLNLCMLGLVEIPANVLALFFNKNLGRRRSISLFLLICAVANLIVIFIPDTAEGIDPEKLKTALVLIGKFGITGSYSTIYLYAAELFPTIVRNQAVGASSFFENIGSIAAPNMVYANNSLNNLPLVLFGGMTIVGCGLVLLLPETLDRPLPQTIEDVERNIPSQKQIKTPSI
ncbi:solute carrier family 22 member 5 [Biomphalaria pfeifferi]|uniref:Solute carrier family 22 member 5 n=1 Tax=Biomphalaria pfeifferi TaxID=112525 RepID=A0AAD8FN23_BIOPF|nr:solute carrier family 22 member 5 [Biomphalaria pfeifferi]